VVDLCSV